MLSIVDIVIVNWNAGEQLRDCLESIRRVDRDGFLVSRVCVIDNASVDNSMKGIELIELAMDLQGANLAVTDAAVAEDRGRWQRSFFTGLASTIGGGTSEIQRNVIAQRVLGLPRAR